MATEYANIDDMLIGGSAPSTPPTSESKEDYIASDDAPANDLDRPEVESKDDFYSTPEERATSNDERDEKEPQESLKNEDDYDDYGNNKTPQRTYTEEEVNEMFRKRNKNKSFEEQEHLKQQMNLAQSAKDFEYNPESSEPWEAQLEKFVEKTVSKIGQKQAQQQQQHRDAQHQSEFEDKFTRGMTRFGDFRDVVGAQPITDPMTLALREMTDPTAFIYAASKRNPAELQRIANLASPHAQMMEMAKLEDRMRNRANGTKAPKPVSRSRDDGGMPTNSKKTEPSIEDLIAHSDAKRKALLNQKRGR